MEIKSILHDKKVDARSILVEVAVRDYLDLAKKIFKSNEFQRKRVRGSKTVYSLLKSDIVAGCVMPPLVLAYTKPGGDLEDSLGVAFIEDPEYFVLLDGLQRTYTLMDIETELSSEPVAQEKFLKGVIRCEIYEGINRLGILYRMLTLNTGQSAMSLRHQIEIMYLDFLDTDLGGVRLVREVDEVRATQSSEYNFRDVIEGFNSYIERSESPLDRGDILENISSLENIAKENGHRDLFREFVLSWDKFVRRIKALDMKLPTELAALDIDDVGDKSKRPWGSTGTQVFKRVQAMAGFGAAIGILRDDDDDISFANLPMHLIEIGADSEEFILDFNDSIERINRSARKIGNAQRLFFRQFFKMLFWDESGAYMNLALAQKEAYKSAVKIGI